MGKKSKKRGQNGPAPWWKKHGLPPIFGTMLDAMSKDDGPAMTKSVLTFFEQHPSTDLFDPSEGGFQVPLDVVGMSPQAFGLPPGATVLASLWVACYALGAWECFARATGLTLREGHVDGVHSSYASMAHMLARFAPADKEYRNLHHALSTITYLLAQVGAQVNNPTWDAILDSAFVGGAAEPYWMEARAKVLAEREDKEIYADSGGEGQELEPPVRRGGDTL